MKVALITEILNQKSGSRAPIELAKALNRRGISVHIYSTSNNLDDNVLNDLSKHGIKVRFIYKKSLFSMRNLINDLKNTKYNLISFHGTLIPFLVCFLSGKPIFLTYYGTQFDALLDRYFPRKNYSIRIGNLILNSIVWLNSFFLVKLSKKVIPISKCCQSEIKNLFGLNTNYIYLGVNKAKYKKTYHKTFNLITVSRFVPYKKFEKIIKIYKSVKKLHPHVSLTIIGSIVNKNYFEYIKYISSGLVNIIPNADEQELNKSYNISDIYLNADQNLFFGLPIMEASSRGLPTITLDIKAAGELVINNKSGFVCKNESEMKSKIIFLIKNRNILKSLGKTARDISLKYSWDNTAKEYEKIFQNI